MMTFIAPLIDEFIRDVTSVVALSKSEVRQRLAQLLTEREEIAFGQGVAKAHDVPMGVSQWRNHGIKYHYDKYFNIVWPQP